MGVIELQLIGGTERGTMDLGYLIFGSPPVLFSPDCMPNRCKYTLLYVFCSLVGVIFEQQGKKEGEARSDSGLPWNTWQRPMNHRP